MSIIRSFFLSDLNIKKGMAFSFLLLGMYISIPIKKVFLYSMFVWCAFYLIHDLFTKRIFYKSYFFWLKLLFIISCSFSIIINVSKYGELIATSKILVSYIIYFFILMCNDSLKSQDELLKDIYSFNKFFIAIAMIPISISTFSALTNIGFVLNDVYFPQLMEGFYTWFWSGRYFTLFINPNGYASIIFCVIVACCINLSINCNNSKAISKNIFLAL